MSARNPIRGHVPCPVAGCHERCPCRQFAVRAQSESGRRKGGKWYFDCAVHGRMGFDGSPAMQEWVLEKIEWADGHGPNASAAGTPQKPPAPAAAAAVKPPAARQLAAVKPAGKAPAPKPPPKRSWLEEALK